jgi:UDP-glucose 4-epimerase
MLITGGAGFLGRHMAHAWASKGYRVTVIDNLLNGNSTFHCAELNMPTVSCIKDTVFNAALVERLVGEHRIIAHFATVVGVEETIANTIPTIENVRGTVNIVRHLTPDHVALFTSSADVYGAHSHFYDRPMQEDDHFIFEHGQVKRWVYPHVKALEETLVNASPAKSIIIRVFNTYGPGMDYPEPRRVVPHFTQNILERRPLRLSGVGAQRRSFCYIGDMIRGLVAAVEYGIANEGPLSDCFNLGAVETRTIRRVAEQMIDTALSIGLIDEPLPILSNAFHYTQPFDDSWNRVPDITRAREKLRYTPMVTFEDGLRRTLFYYSRQRASLDYNLRVSECG